MAAATKTAPAVGPFWGGTRPARDFASPSTPGLAVCWRSSASAAATRWLPTYRHRTRGNYGWIRPGAVITSDGLASGLKSGHCSKGKARTTPHHFSRSVRRFRSRFANPRGVEAVRIRHASSIRQGCPTARWFQFALRLSVRHRKLLPTNTAIGHDQACRCRREPSGRGRRADPRPARG
jgi:hypothetical protein